MNKIKLKEDEKLGKGSIAVIEFSGGGAACSIADKASFTVFRHVVRGEDKKLLIKEVEEAAIRAGINSKYEVVFRKAPYKNLTDARNGLPTTTRESPDFSHGECQHSSDEWVSIDSLVKRCNIVYEFLVNLLKY